MATYITSDLHGDLERFKSLLKKIQFDETQDFIYILGDVVDRGDKGLELLFLIKQYMDRGVMHLIKGNHELFAQMYLENRLTARQWMLWGGIDTVREMEALTEVQSKELYGFLRGLEHYRVIDFPK